MKNNEAINSIKSAFEENNSWLEHGHLLIQGKQPELVQDPMPFTQCEFGLWLYSQGHSFTRFSWFKDVQEQHQKTHEAYSQLHSESLRVYKPKTQDELQISLNALKEQTTIFSNVLKIAESRIVEMSEDEYDQLINVSNQQVTQTKPNDLLRATDQNVIEFSLSAPQLKLRKQLKEQDLKQVELEKKLTQQELDQLLERQKLTEQGVEQLQQYQDLKAQEAKLLEQDSEEKEIHNKKEQNIIICSLKDIDNQTIIKQQELEQMELLSLKLEQKKNEGQKQEKENVKKLETQCKLIKDDVLALDLQQEQRNIDLAQLIEQVRLTEQDLKQLEETKLIRLAEVKELKDQGEKFQAEIEMEDKRQYQLNEHKHGVEESKHRDLNVLKERYQSMQQDLLSLEQALQLIKQTKLDSEALKRQEIDEIKQQQILKNEILEALNTNQYNKQQDLEKLGNHEVIIMKELQELDGKIKSADSVDG